MILDEDVRVSQGTLYKYLHNVKIRETWPAENKVRYKMTGNASHHVLKVKDCLDKKNHTHFGSGGPSARGFMESLHRERNTRKASFCRM